MPDLGWQELIIILLIVVVIFGAGRLPEIGGAIGKSIKEFKKEADLPDAPGLRTTSGTDSISASAASGAPVSGSGTNAQLRADEI